MTLLHSLKLTHRFALLIAAFTLGFVIYGSWSFKVLDELKINSALYQRIVLGKDLVADILPPPEYIIESYLVTMQLINEVDSREKNNKIEQLKRLKDDYEKRHAFWLKQNLGSELKSAFLEQAHAPAMDFYETVFKNVIPAVQKNEANTLNNDALNLVLPQIKSAYDAHRKAIDNVIPLIEQRNKTDENLAEERIYSASMVLLAVLILTLSVGVLLGVIITRGVIKQLGGDPADVAATVKKFSKGDFSDELVLKTGDKSSLLYDLKKMQKIINSFVTAHNIVAKAHADGMISELIWADKFPGSFGRMALEINEVVGTHIAVNKHIIEVISQYAKGDFSQDIDRLPGENAEITEAIDKVKKALTSISNEISMLSMATAIGDFSKRGNDTQFEYIFRDIIVDINTLIQTCDTGFSDIERVVEAMAKGDLTQKINNDHPGTFGKVSRSVNSTVDNLKALVSEIRSATDAINSASKEIAAGNNDLSHRTEEQAASLEQTAASMEELTSTVQQNTENARQANHLAKGASEIADKGVAVVGQVVATMNSIHDSSRKIAAIISVIDSIAFQTNILALNAAVEAARAGEQGRGFAVVAEEVRNLAQRAAVAAGEIKSLISDSEEKVEDGSKLVTQAGLTIKEIVSAIQRVAAVMAQITSASVEQSSGISQVNQAIAQMDDVTQQNAALVEQAAAAAESMEDQAQNLSGTVAVFKIDEMFNPSSAQRAMPAKIQTYKGNRTIAVPEIKSIHNLEAINADLDKALHKHAEWKVKFRTAITHHEKMDVATISKDNCCEFGKWLYGDTKQKLGHLESFSECLSKHAMFHIEAGKVAQAINDKRFNEAHTMLSTESGFIDASSAVGVAIMRLKKDVASSTSAPVITKPQSVARQQTEDVSMELDTALHKHAEWKVKFRTAIANHEKLDAMAISKDTNCDFGKWLHDDIKHHFSHLTGFSDCLAKHAEFHIEAGKVAQTINDEKYSAAQSMLNTGSAFTTASSKVGTAIMRLKKEIGLSTNPIAVKPKSQPVAVANDEWEEF